MSIFIINKDGELFGCGYNICGSLGRTQKNSNKIFEKINVEKKIKFVTSSWDSSGLIDDDGNIFVSGKCSYATKYTNQNPDDLIYNFTQIKIKQNIVKLTMGNEFISSIDDFGKLWCLGNVSNEYFLEFGQPSESYGYYFTKINSSEKYLGAIDTNGDVWTNGTFDEFNLNFCVFSKMISDAPENFDNLYLTNLISFYPSELIIFTSENSIYLYGYENITPDIFFDSFYDQQVRNFLKISFDSIIIDASVNNGIIVVLDNNYNLYIWTSHERLFTFLDKYCIGTINFLDQSFKKIKFNIDFKQVYCDFDNFVMIDINNNIWVLDIMSENPLYSLDFDAICLHDHQILPTNKIKSSRF